MSNVCNVSDSVNDGEMVTVNYVKIEKMKCKDKSIKLAYTNLKDIAEALDCYEFVLLDKASKINDDVYKKATYEAKARKMNTLSENIKGQIGYCVNCGKGRKEREETGLSGIEAAVSGVNN